MPETTDNTSPDTKPDTGDGRPDTQQNDLGRQGDRPVHFTLDGRALSAPTAKQDAADILRLGGLDPAGYDLTLLRPGQAPDKAYGDDRQVHIKDGDEFLSVRQSAQVA